MANLLVIDDEPTICWAIQKLGQTMGHTVSTASSVEQGWELLRAMNESPDLMLLDIRLPGQDGLEAMPDFQAAYPNTPIVMMTAYGDLSTAVEAVRKGAFEYLVKPFELAAVRRVMERALQSQEPPPESDAATSAEAIEEEKLIGQSPAINEVFKRIALVAPSTACVHLYGASGTGKELIARAIHRYSRRGHGPFIAVNLASLSPTLAESELFGHVRGAFTGADIARRGLLEQAHQGTIFLDEVADIPLALQVKLLRALEHGEILPVGGDRPVFADFRVVSATHQNLAEQVSEGKFRHDLYYRLSTFQIEIPPLSARREDIPVIANYFLDILAKKNHTARATLSEEALTELRQRPWHGNVRELRNTMEHALILARGGTIVPEHFPPPLRPGTEGNTEDQLSQLLRGWTQANLPTSEETGDLYERLLELVEPPVLGEAMNHYHQQVATAARSLGIHRITLKKKLDQYGLTKNS